MRRQSRLSAKLANVKLTGKVYGPELKLGFGLGLIIAGFVAAIKATKHPSEDIEEAQDKIIELHENKEELQFSMGNAQYNNEVGKAYGQLAKGYVKTYAGPVLCVAAGVGFIVKSHSDLRQSQLYYAGLAGALSKELDEIHSRIEDKYGKEEADKIVHGFEEKEIEVVEKDEKGKERTVKKKVNVISPDWNGFYTYRWTHKSSSYKKNPMLRASYLEQMNRYANDILAIRRETSPRKIGHLFLQELIQDMDLEIREEGQYVGWLLMDNNTFGDNYVEITETLAYETNPQTGLLEEVSLLTFNVDGNILPTLFPKSGSK